MRRTEDLPQWLKWACTRCRVVPEPAESILEWYADGISSYEYEGESVMCGPDGVSGLLCPGCITEAESGSLKTYHELLHELYVANPGRES